MFSKNKKKYNNKNYSVINKLKADKKISDSVLIELDGLSLEEIIAIKLELTTRFLCGKLYGLPLWRVTKQTVTDALLKTALSISKTKKEASRFLGIDYSEYNKLLKKYKTVSFFEDGGEMVSTEEE
jgi:hypothetical protein